jgi:predicted alpha/beta hydrolase family esterase
MTRPILIVPGLNGSSDDHWQSHWLSDYPQAVLVDQADWANPHRLQWLHRLEQAVLGHPGALIVAHSLGAILTAALAMSPVSRFVGGALLVAPADIERTSVLHARSYEFGAMPTQRLPFPALLVASENDPYMALDKAQTAATGWSVPLINLGEAGHINVQSGFGRWPQGYALAMQVLQRHRNRPHRQVVPTLRTALV